LWGREDPRSQTAATGGIFCATLAAFAGEIPAVNEELREYNACVGAAGWRLTTYATVGSTNDLARGLSGWSAVRADRQTGGRGRLGRKFVSDEGGLWLSAVLPAEGGPARWTGFSLAAGLHALRAIRDLGVGNARLRWPNDILAGARKLAGLLIEQPDPERLIVGIGVNVTNAPWQADPSLVATRLADLLPSPPDVDDLCVLLLDAFGEAHAEMNAGGLRPVIEKLNAGWTELRPVELELRGRESVRGQFAGLEGNGDLRLVDASGRTRVIAHLDVERLRELDV
jgi:BirA family biotin operon repressor/biotin-[acetyl-CoA-carboxylase] ligase